MSEKSVMHVVGGWSNEERDTRDAEIARLRAEVERLTRERDEWQGEAELKGAAHRGSVKAHNAAEARVAEAERKRDEARDEALSLREEREDYRKAKRELEARVAALESGIGEMLQAFDGTDVELQARCMDALRALLAQAEDCPKCIDGFIPSRPDDGGIMRGKPCPACGEEER